jgi:hypothetical protein
VFQLSERHLFAPSSPASIRKHPTSSMTEDLLGLHKIVLHLSAQLWARVGFLGGGP